MEIVGISLVRNEDLFVRQAILNVAGFCDRILVADHLSTDRTPDILRELSEELDHLDVVRISHSAASHSLIEGLAGTETWVLSVDGDELYDPVRLRRFRQDLEGGAHDDVFRVRPAAMHCDRLDPEAGASGYLSPPSRPLVGILNFAAIDSWSDVRSERMHGGDIRFRKGFGIDSWRHLGMDDGWDTSPFRALHVCFLERSSIDPPARSPSGRPNLAETGAYRRGLVGSVERAARRLVRRGAVPELAGWKAEKYRRGDHVTVEAADFLR